MKPIWKYCQTIVCHKYDFALLGRNFIDLVSKCKYIKAKYTALAMVEFGLNPRIICPSTHIVGSISDKLIIYNNLNKILFLQHALASVSPVVENAHQIMNSNITHQNYNTKRQTLNNTIIFMHTKESIKRPLVKQAKLSVTKIIAC